MQASPGNEEQQEQRAKKSAKGPEPPEIAATRPAGAGAPEDQKTETEVVAGRGEGLLDWSLGQHFVGCAAMGGGRRAAVGGVKTHCHTHLLL